MCKQRQWWDREGDWLSASWEGNLWIHTQMKGQSQPSKQGLRLTLGELVINGHRVSPPDLQVRKGRPVLMKTPGRGVPTDSEPVSPHRALGPTPWECSHLTFVLLISSNASYL